MIRSSKKVLNWVGLEPTTTEVTSVPLTKSITDSSWKMADNTARQRLVEPQIPNEM
jgi:hypothetical protein